MTVSFGVIETIGLTAATHAADTACKAAGVRFTGYRKIGSGLVSVCFEGEISAVQVAIDNGVNAIKDSSEVCMSLVIARPDDSVLAMLRQVAISNEPEAHHSLNKNERSIKDDTHTLSIIDPELSAENKKNSNKVVEPSAPVEKKAISQDDSATDEGKPESDVAKKKSTVKPNKRRNTSKAQGDRK